MTFTPYEGWEEDVQTLVHHERESIVLPTRFVVAASRLRSAFEAQQCGKRLWHGSRTGGSPLFVETDWRQLTCGLPAGHHPFDGPTRSFLRSKQSAADEVTYGRCTQCGLPPVDPIHSPGHLADVPEDAWR